MNPQPNYPFDLTDYTCFSIINCPVEQVVTLLKEYANICIPEDRVPFCFQIAALPEHAKWTLVRWPQPGRFYDLMNLTLWLMGYRPGLGGENPFLSLSRPQKRLPGARFWHALTMTTGWVTPYSVSGKTGVSITQFPEKNCAGLGMTCSPKSITSTAAAIPPPVLNWNG